MRTCLERESKLRKVRAEAARRLNLKMRRSKLAACVLRRQKLRLASQRKAERDRLDSVPLVYDDIELSVVGPAGVTARRLCLERLKLHSPALSARDEVAWPGLRHWICTASHFRYFVGLTSAAVIGAQWLTEIINRTLESLGTFYRGATQYNQALPPGSGNALAFSELVARIRQSKERQKAGPLMKKPNVVAEF